MELHKREISNGNVPKIFIEKYLECKRCEMKFRYKEEWISHKLEHVKSATPDSTFEWGCEICGKIVSRKERLIQHVKAHIRENSQQKEKHDDDDNNVFQSDNYIHENNEGQSDSNSNSYSMDERSNQTIKNNTKEENERHVIAHVTSDGTIMRTCDTENEIDFNDGDDDFNNESNPNSSTNNSEDEDEHRSDSEESFIESDNDDDVPAISHNSYSCDLCHVNFKTSKELQCHVTSHFLNGPGSVTLKSEDEET